ncbi:hypothetical protein [Enterobacter soli]|uniref:hypothetical protein n=1 Tax=Enterobacter soli TaxID=885040 RepID=UPI0034CE87D4
MKPIQYTLLWIGEALLFSVVLIVLYAFIPESKAYNIIRNFTGVIPGDTWDKYYFLFLCLSSLFIVAVIVFISAVFKKDNL